MTVSQPLGESLMPTDVSAGKGAGPPGDDAGTDPTEDLVFAEHDLRREAPRPAGKDDHVDFAVADRATPAAATSDHDTFVIGEVTADTPLDALVVGGAKRKAAGTAPAASPAATSAPASTAKPGFRVTTHSNPTTALPSTELPWTVRDPNPAPAGPPRGWTSRQSELMDRSAQDTVSRLREDAVHTTWKAAWIAVTSADRRLFKKRDW
jgi:hypothetical protein